MKRSLLMMLFLLLTGSPPASAQETQQLPELHVIKTVTLGPSYGCRAKATSAHPYDGPALFLSEHSKRRNAPELLFNGACGGPDFFDSSTAGDDMALIADLGKGVALESVTAQGALQGVPAAPLGAGIPAFSLGAFVKPGHTYVVLLNKRDFRGLFAFTVTDYVLNERAVLRYAVKEYQLQRTVAESPGFDWGKLNAQK